MNRMEECQCHQFLGSTSGSPQVCALGSSLRRPHIELETNILRNKG